MVIPIYVEVGVDGEYMLSLSDFDTQTFGACLMLEDLILLLPSNPVLLLGFSLGGYIASYFAVNYPQRVEKLFVLFCVLLHIFE